MSTHVINFAVPPSRIKRVKVAKAIAGSLGNSNKCGDCRLCWDKSVDNVSYKLH